MEKVNAEVFLKVVKTGSFKRAADELGYTQAGISYIINAMEEEFDLKLFSREYGGVRLTSEGELLLPDIRQLATCEHAIQERVNDLKGLNAGNVRVSTFTSTYIHWLPGIMKTFKEKYPKIEIKVIHCEEEDLYGEMIYNNEVDCGFYMGSIRDDVDALELMDAPITAVVSPDHPMVKKGKFPISELANYPYIEMSYDKKSSIVSRLFREYNISPKASYITENDYAAISMASQGMGYCLFSEFLVKGIGFNVLCLPLDPPFNCPVGIAAKSLDSCTSATDAFIRCAVEWIHENSSLK